MFKFTALCVTVIIIIIIIMILAFVVFNPGDLYYLGYQKIIIIIYVY